MSENRPIALSFDVELWNESEWLIPYTTKEMFAFDPFPGSMRRIIDLLKNHNAHATFFVTLIVIKNYPGIVRELFENGHEIAIHGPKHIKLRDYRKKEFRVDLAEQVLLIERCTGRKPTGYRAPHFSLSKETMWVLDILKEFNLKYDSSIFPINLGEYGNSQSKSSPYEIIPGITEIPITIASFGKIKMPFAGGVYFRFLPLWMFKALIRYVSKSNTVNLYFHPHELDSLTPKIKKGPVFKRTLKYWNTKKSFKKFETLLKEFNFESITNLYHQDNIRL